MQRQSIVKETKPLDLCIAEAYSVCDQVSPWNEETQVGDYLQRTLLLYKLCSLKHDILIKCMEAD